MKLKASPPKPLTDDLDRRVADVISGATAMPGTAAEPITPHRPMLVSDTPWKDARVRKDLMVQLNVRLPEPLALKLKQVCRVTDCQKQDLVAEALELLLNAKLLEIGYSENDI